MTNQIGDLLDKNRFAEPAEVKVIRGYMQENFNADGQVTIQKTQIIITVKGAALAGALRMRIHDLQALCNTSKRLVIRIG